MNHRISKHATSGRPSGINTSKSISQAVASWFEQLEQRRLMAMVATDQSDYQFGETAMIQGADFAPNETVELQIRHADGTSGSNDDPQNQPWDAQADAAGSITSTWLVNDPDALGATYVLTARGLASGLTAQTTFTDSTSVQSVTLNGGSSVFVLPGGTISASITDKNTANSNWRSTGWRISTTPPGMVTVVNHTNHDGNGTYTETFSITAPSTPGTYNAYFIAYTDDAGSAGPSGTFTLTNAIIVNTAPVLGNTTPTFPAINKNDITNSGQDVATFISGLSITDADASALKGIAVTTVDNTNGTWQYSTNSGGTWTNFGSPSTSNARLLSNTGSNRIRFVPNSNYVGTATFAFRAWDQSDGSANGGTGDASTNGGATPFSAASGTATLSINAVNVAPVITATGGSVSFTENAAPQVIDSGLTVTDTDSTNLVGATVSITTAFTSGQDVLGFSNQLGITGSYNAATGVLTLSGTTTVANYQAALRSITYSNGNDNPSTTTRTISFQVDDGSASNNLSNVATRNVTVTAVNDAPTLNPISDPAAILEDAGQQTINLTGISAGGGEIQTLTVTATSNNTAVIPNPTVTYTSPNATGSLSYTPVANASGSAVITVTVTDNGGTANGGINSITRTFTVVVNAVNDAPSFTKGTDQTVQEDAGTQSINGWATSISAGPANESGQSLNFTVSNDNNSLFSVQPSISSNGTLTYTSAPNANGSATVTVQLHDSGGTTNGGSDASAAQTFTITVNAVNDAPVANNQSVSTNEDTPLSITLVATDADSSTLTYAIASGPAHGALIRNSEGVYTYTPNANYNGSDSFTFKANDGSLDSNVATVSIDITAVNDVPVADPKSASTNEMTPVTVTLSGSDIDGDALVFKITALPSHGSLYDGSGTSGHLIEAADLAGGWYTVAGTQVTYLPANGYFGPDSFAYATNDGQVNSTDATVSITVHDITPPQIVLTGSTGTENDGQDQSFAWTVTDPSGLGPVGVTITQDGATVFTSSSASGTFDFNGLGLGLFEIVLNATDAVGNNSSASRSVTVNDDDTGAPIISLGGSIGSETDGQSQSFNWSLNDASNLATVSVTITHDGDVVYSSSNLADASGSFDFNSLGLGTFQITVSATDADNDRPSDGVSASDSRTVNIGDDDAAAPLITLGGSQGSETDGQDQQFTWSVVDAGSGLGAVSISITRDGAEVCSSTDTSGTFDFNSLGLGTYSISVSAADADNDHSGDSLSSSASQTVVVSDDDAAAPIITLGGSQGSEADGQDQAFTWDIADAGSGVASVSVSVTRDGTEIFTSTDQSDSFDFNNYGLGTYQINVTATDADADRADDSLTSTASRSVVVSDDDKAAPVITLGGSQGSETDGQDQSFTWDVVDAGSGLGSVSVSITKGGSEIYTSTDPSGSFDFNSYGLGTYAIDVSATDADADRAGDALSSTASRSVIVSDDDTAAPVIALSGSEGSETDGQNQSFIWSVSDTDSGVGGVGVTITRDGTEVYSSTASDGTFDFNSLGLGTYTISVSATDADSDRADDSLTSTASRTVVVSDDETVGPIIETSGSEGAQTDSEDQIFGWTVGDVGSGLDSASITVTRDGQVVYASSDASGSFDFNASGLGSYTMTISATDADDDRADDKITTSASRTVVITDDDTAAPIITISGSHDDETDGQDQVFSWNISDAGSGVGSATVTITKDGDVVHTSSDSNGSFDFNTYGLGTYAIQVSATDADNDRSDDSLSSSASSTVIVSDDDTAAPVITLGGSSASETDGQDQVFTWNVEDIGSGLSSIGVTVTKDGNPIFTSNAASGSFDFNSYGLGTFQIQVDATDADSDRLDDSLSSSDARSVTVTDDDTTPPLIVLGGSVDNQTDGENQVLTWDISDAGSGIDTVLVTITRDGSAIQTSGATTGSFDFNSFGLGTYVMQVLATDTDNDRANDALSSSDSRTVIVSDDDTAAPVIALSGSEGSETDGQDQSFIWSVGDADSGLSAVSISVTRDGTEVYNSTNPAGSFDFNSLGLGTYVMQVSSTDADNDRADDALSSSASRSVVVSDDDTAAPIITLDGSTGSETDGQDQVFTWNVSDAGSGIASVSVSVTKDGIEVYNSDAAAGSFDFNSLGLGTYQINVTATDADSDRADDSFTSTASQSVTVSDDDTAAPVISLGGSEANESDGQAQSFSWNISDPGSGLANVSVVITHDSAVIYSSNNLADASSNFNFDSYGLGTYTISVSATDADGDRTDDALGSSASRTVVVSDDDTSPPEITLGGSTGAETDGQDQVFTWDVADAGSGLSSVTVTVTRNGTELFTSTAASGSFDFNSYGLGTYELYVSATDADNDRTDDAMTNTASRTVTVSDDDMAAPVITLGGSSGSATDGDNRNFTWNVTDAGSGVGSVIVSITKDGTEIFTSSDSSGSFDLNGYDLGSFAINVTATDADKDHAGDSLSSSDSHAVDVNDDDTKPPAINLGGSLDTETDGQDQVFNWDASDVTSGLSSLSVTITRDDGTGPTVVYSTTNLADAVGSFDFNTLGLGTYAVTVSATDADNDRIGDSLTATDSRTVVVNDDDVKPPTIVLGGSAGTESHGLTQEFSWSTTDVGSGIAGVDVTVTRNGATIFTSTASSGNFNFDSYVLGTYVISVTATDGDNDRANDSLTSSSSRQVVVINDAPSAIAGNDQTVNEGSSVDFSAGASFDSDGDTLTYQWDFGDGTTGAGLSPVHTYFDDGNYTVTVTANDGFTTSTDHLVVHVKNVAPTVQIGGSNAVAEGASESLSMTLQDPGQDTHTMLWHVVSSNGQIVADGTGSSFSFTPNDNGTYQVALTCTDDDGGVGTANYTISVSNVAPTLANFSLTPSINENGVATFSGNIIDPGAADSFSIVVNWGEGAPQTYTFAAGTTAFSCTHVFHDDNPTATGSDSYSPTITLSDDDGASTTASRNIVVNNVAPVLGTMAGPTGPIVGGQTVTYSAPFADAGDLDAHSVVINWGDGNVTAGVLAESNGSGSFSGSHVYSVNGSYAVTFTLCDDDGGTSVKTSNLLASNSIFVLNPSAQGSLSISGNAVLGVNGRVVVDSNNTIALAASGNSKLTASSFTVLGGVQITGNAILSGPVTHSSQADPLAGLVVPAAGTLLGAVNVAGTTSLTINPGTYTQISVSGSGRLVMNPGVYIIAGGGFSVSGNAGVTGQGVSIVNTTGTGGSAGAVSVSGNGAFKLTPTTSGPLNGILIVQPAANTKPMSITGNATLGLAGTIYAPKAQVTISGNGTITETIVADQVRLSGNAGSSLVAAGTDTSGSVTGAVLAGQLLTGAVWVSVDYGTTGATPAEQARFLDSIAALNNTFGRYGVSLIPVDNATPTEDIRIHLTDATPRGGMSQGVLGFATVEGDIYVVSSWDWYTGGDTTSVGSAQYDYQTVLTHELGHAIGLDHSADNNSVMYESLGEGVARRAFTTWDLSNLADSQASGSDDPGGHALMAAPHSKSTTPAISPSSMDRPGKRQQLANIVQDIVVGSYAGNGNHFAQPGDRSKLESKPAKHSKNYLAAGIEHESNQPPKGGAALMDWISDVLGNNRQMHHGE